MLLRWGAMRGWPAAMPMLVACYQPSVATGVPCASNGDCPGDQVCARRLDAPVCVDDPAAMPDAGAVEIDAAVPPPDGPPTRTIPPGAVLWLQMDDDPANGAVDSAGTHVVTCTAACPSVVTGRFGSAYLFAGAHRLETPDAPELRPGSAFTAAAWVKLDALPGDLYGTPVCKVLDPGEASFCLSIRPNGKPTYYTAGDNTAEGARAMMVGAWHHLAMTWDGTTKRGYLDGTPYAMEPVAAIAATAAPFVVGAFQLDTFRVAGAIDDVVLYNRALTANEIVQLATP